MNTVIKVENLSKQYRLGELGTGTLSHDLNRWWHKIRGKEDPYLKVGDLNDRTTKGSSEYVWALRDINFEVKQGEVLGIIGKNGAGKSTLLKLLSRVTAPTTGAIKAKGRIASLLEVGTGFHEELTGRENIFLNGAILGMTKAEIRSKLDEIISFSGTERYIDTPVKRYSSGMRVRLAFAVAAHLDPEILIVDEVLAVGDAEFQKKAIGKMQEVSKGGGKTVLFVSHNMEAVQNLCTRGIVLSNGGLQLDSTIEECFKAYLGNTKQGGELSKSYTLDNAPGNFNAKLLSAKVINEHDPGSFFTTGTGFSFEFDIYNQIGGIQQLDITYHLFDERGILIYVGSTAVSHEPQKYGSGFLNIKTSFPPNILNEGIYTIGRLLLVKNRGHIMTEWKDVLSFEILPLSNGYIGASGGKEGVLKIYNLPWDISYTN
ncbi:polysaccharide ABC transporter ATP-binding protein [Pontibacter ruber]|uniref:Polysaccharide ABC transporter ATP-binding protein n=1 Tax=Pontibacter ruber TaxID=1343895 RepID=A0ABW5CUF7_9BACT|nr:ABC transporter ATP-binding protein [Pontibacter ruber]